MREAWHVRSAVQPGHFRRAQDSPPGRADEGARPERDRPAPGRDADPASPRRRAGDHDRRRAAAAPVPRRRRGRRRRRRRPPPAKAEDEHIAVIKSPMVGTFYTAPNPDSPAYVKVGDHVGPETTVCIVEAMKVFNEIPAEVSGKIVTVLVENGEPVEFGQPLFKVDTRA